jgi:hypothetical protein
MLKGLTLQELAAKIEGNRAVKRDFIASTDALTMQVQSDRTTVLEVPDRSGRIEFPIMPLAHDQIGARTGIPAKYYDRMLTAAPGLLATNVNAWFRKDPEKRMVRTLGGDARAFLSNRYQRIENEEIAEVALPILADIPDVQIVSSEVTDKRMYIQAVAPRVQGEVKRGDVVQAGVVISNSEVGCGAVRVSAMLWRLVCLNGMIAGDAFRAYHVGRQVEDNEALWADDTRKADDRAVLLKVRDMVRAATDTTRFRQRIEQMNGLTQIEVSGNPERAVEVLAQKIGATDEEKGGILAALIKGGDLSAWGLVNAVTNQAHRARNYDRAVDFETAGGQLVELPRSAWREVLEAA